MKKILCLGFGLSLAAVASNNIGISAHPVAIDEKIINTEFTTNLSAGSGMGAQARYFQRLNRDLNADGGLGLNFGDRRLRAFVGSEYTFLPDYGNQPRLSAKAILERFTLGEDDYNAIGVAPIISKGLVVSGKEVFPFFSLPTKLALNPDRNSYETQVSAGFGLTGQIPIEGYENLLANIEANINLRNSFNSIVVGMSLPLQ